MSVEIPFVDTAVAPGSTSLAGSNKSPVTTLVAVPAKTLVAVIGFPRVSCLPASPK